VKPEENQGVLVPSTTVRETQSSAQSRMTTKETQYTDRYVQCCKRTL